MHNLSHNIARCINLFSFSLYNYRKSHLLSSHEKWIFSSISHINSSLPGVDHTFTHHGESRVPQKLIKPMGGGARDTITCDFGIFLERWTWVVYSDTNRRATWFQSFLREWIQQQTLTYPYNQQLRMDDRSRISPTFFPWEECSSTVLHCIFIEPVLTLKSYKTLSIVICPVLC